MKHPSRVIFRHNIRDLNSLSQNWRSFSISTEDKFLLRDTSLTHAYERDVSKTSDDCNLKIAVGNAFAVFKKTDII